MTSSEEERIEPLSRVPRKVWMSVLGGIAIMIAIAGSLFYLEDLVDWSRPDSESVFASDIEDDTDTRPVRDGQTLTPTPSPADNDIPAFQAVSGDPNSSDRRGATSLGDSSSQLQAIGTVKLLQVKSKGKRLQNVYQTLAEHAAEFEMSITDLLQNEAGSRIASMPELVDQFEALRMSPVPTLDEVESLGTPVQQLLDPIGNLDPSGIRDEYLASLDSMHEQLREKSDSVAKSLRVLKSIVSDAGSADPSTSSLQRVLKSREDSRLEEERKKLAEAAKKARAARLDADAKEAADRANEIAAKEAELEKAKAKQRQVELQAKIDDAKQAAELAETRAKLERDFNRNYPAMKSYLTPFTSDGLTQPGRRTFGPAAKRGPVSLAKLKGTGALEEAPGSRNLLYYMTANGSNDRNLGAFPRFQGGRSDTDPKQPLLKSIQDFLNTYGDLMVEKKLLAP